MCLTVGLSPQPLHPAGAPKEGAPVHRATAGAAPGPLCVWVLSHSLHEDGLPTPHYAPHAHQVSISHAPHAHQVSTCISHARLGSISNAPCAHRVSISYAPHTPHGSISYAPHAHQVSISNAPHAHQVSISHAPYAHQVSIYHAPHAPQVNIFLASHVSKISTVFLLAHKRNQVSTSMSQNYQFFSIDD